MVPKNAEEKFNSQVVKESLNNILRILTSCKVEYRLLGSVVTASLLGYQHRNLGDIDIIADVSQKEFILKELLDLGYRPKKGRFAFARKYLSLDSLEHDTLLEVGIFWGKFLTDGSFLIGAKTNGCVIDAHSLTKQKYSLYGMSFYGLPQSTIARGIITSSSNPKRKRELALIKDMHIVPQKQDYIHVFAAGHQMDWIYYSTMTLLNVVGTIRVKLGFPFDPWR